MTNEQAERLIEELERIADALSGLSNLAMPRDEFLATRPGNQPHLVDCLATIADLLGRGRV